MGNPIGIPLIDPNSVEKTAQLDTAGHAASYSGLLTALAAKISTSARGAANGVASLDANSKVIATGGAVIGSTTADDRQPFKVSSGVSAAQAGTTDHVGVLAQTVVVGAWAESTGVDPNRVWGFDVYTTTGTASGDANGVLALQNLIETSVRAPAGTTITSVMGLQAEADFLGGSAGATVGTITSLRAAAPTYTGGASAGSATTVIGAKVDSVPAGTFGATSAYSLLVMGGYSEVNGNMKVISESASTVTMILKQYPSQTADSLRQVNTFDAQIFHLTSAGGIGGQGPFASFEGVGGQTVIGGRGPAGQSAISMGTAEDTKIWRKAAGVLVLGTADITAPTMTGHGLVFGNVTAAPSTNPVGGPVVYAESGAGKARSPSGNVTTFAPNTAISVGAAATDAATTQTLANNLRTALVSLGYVTT